MSNDPNRRSGRRQAQWGPFSATFSPPPEPSSSLLPKSADIGEALPGLVRLAATAWVRTAEWTLVAGLKTGRRALEVVANPASAADSARELISGVAQAGAVFGEVAKAVSNGVSVSQAVVQVSASLTETVTTHEVSHQQEDEERQRQMEQSLRAQGQALLTRSRDVWNTERGHPAYARILEEMAPDEARILLLLLRGGPQPAVDIRTGGPIGVVSSRLVAPGLNMIGPRAGVRYLDQVPAYLNNLFRLGLIWFSQEQLRDPLEYQVVEAQPDVLAAMHSVRAHKVVRRSIHLTPFGIDFCRACLVSENEDIAVLPEHQAPNVID
jgi:Abortive infection alpha